MDVINTMQQGGEKGIQITRHGGAATWNTALAEAFLEFAVTGLRLPPDQSDTTMPRSCL